MRKERERKEKAEAAGEEVPDLMDEDNDEDDVPAITVYAHSLPSRANADLPGNTSRRPCDSPDDLFLMPIFDDMRCSARRCNNREALETPSRSVKINLNQGAS
jgi:hypothetical protein